MRNLLKILIVTISCVLVAAACERQPKLFPPGDGDLRCSQDTLRFDTLFSTITSTTAWLKIYNVSDRDLTIDSVYFLQGKSGYRASVDALPLSECKHLSLPAGDSLFVFVELTPSMQELSGPQSIVDELCFAYGQEKLRLVLEAFAWNAQLWRGKTITADTLLRADIPYVIYDSLVVSPDATLRLEEGVHLYFHDGATLLVYGTIKSQGSLQQPVVFRGDRLDWAFDDFPYEWYPGQWTGVYLGTDSYDNEFDYTHIRGAYYGIISDSSSLEKQKLKLTNSQIFNMVYTNLYAMSTKMEVANTVLANSGSYTVALIGGDALFTHCTIANYQVLVNREEATPSLVVVNFTQDDRKKYHPYPLQQASFRNCIVYGSRENELGFGLLEDYAYQFDFQSCLLRNVEPLSEDVATKVLYNEDPRFKAINRNYHYDFHLDSVSPAVNAGDSLLSLPYPFDADANDRLKDDAPDLGAYEFF